VGIVAIRDAKFYTWRFIDGPAGKQPAFAIVDKRGKTLGICALELMEGGRMLRIVDLFTIPGAWHKCLTAITRYAADHTNAAHVDLKLMTLDGRKRQMWRAGFIERETKPFLCVTPTDGDTRFF